MPAWWSGRAASFRQEDPARLVDHLARRLVETHMVNHEAQIRAWRDQIDLLRAALRTLPDWHVLLEYPLLRLGRRIDAIILTGRAILVVEFKTEATGFTNADREQVEDYALDLFDFHAGSRIHPIIPVLVARHAPIPAAALPLFWHAIAPVIDANGATLEPLLQTLAAQLPDPHAPLDPHAWDNAAYRPVPTIVEAATMLYRKHGVADLASSRADVTNLTRTTDAIRAAIAAAADARRHIIVFVTGIPGAGKTLCGLNAVFTTAHQAAFLTGNLPLVHVLRAALARDAREQGRSLRDAAHKLEAAIQPLLGFLRDSQPRGDAPHEHVIVFDEAQRAWDADFGRRKFNLPDSEAALFLDIMRRHADWAVIVALVGSGQEINTGEAGLASWGVALAARPAWSIMGPATVIGNADPARCLAATRPAGMSIDPALHLDVSVRQIRSHAAADWVDAVLRHDAAEAARIGRAAGGVPFRITRSLPMLRAELRRLSRGSRRAGLVCSADAKRLRADGLSADFPHMDADAVANWFLNAWPDVRASDALELPATQYACQGLELDYVGLCWGGDLVIAPGGAAWRARKFRGTKWQTIKRPEAIVWQINTYRVLLSRARYETILFIPPGDPADETRSPAAFDQVAGFLLGAGATMLEPAPATAASPVPYQGALFDII
ncbi:DUF2075 domain-containing protein [Acidiphilium sp. PA]|uniref:DUF2075 domain-containing protein n=1 Tax=Acidiphilium sp. PA TaxID=2871705 RepID=UPI0022435994|nr:DUF2075 domain-containing protein [Acidiphilium sp. PA]MCW8308497.1 DUF2075 domain-containing protein [Acidiphilium sp. PA]